MPSIKTSQLNLMRNKLTALYGLPTDIYITGDLYFSYNQNLKDLNHDDKIHFIGGDYEDYYNELSMRNTRSEHSANELIDMFDLLGTEHKKSIYFSAHIYYYPTDDTLHYIFNPIKNYRKLYGDKPLTLAYVQSNIQDMLKRQSGMKDK